MTEAISEVRLTVLVVEDETLVRMFLADMLDEAGFKVFEAVSADEAVALLQARPDIQAVVTDVEMLGSMNSFELVRAIRERWPGVRAIVTSGRQAPGPGPDALPEDVPYLTKPYLPATVLNLIRQMAAPQVVELPASDVQAT
ncbi:response regulator [Microvirga sp. GCM10011540]|uniref:response regulator n=1 Tax=Microvirga sp. GCM10011540 TaxID=3317338 RepID=UPI0036210740